MSVSDIVHRFNEHGVPGLLKQPNHKPGKAPVNQRVVNRILKLVQTKRPQDARRWSTREIAKRVGLYLDPPENAIILCVRCCT